MTTYERPSRSGRTLGVVAWMRPRTVLRGLASVAPSLRKPARGLAWIVVFSSGAAHTEPAFAQQPGVVGAPGERRLDQYTFVGTHNSYANVAEGFRGPPSLGFNQVSHTLAQLAAGVRFLEADIWLVRQRHSGGAPSAIVYDQGWVYDTQHRGTEFHHDYLGEHAGTPIDIVVAHNPRDWGYAFHNPDQLFVSYSEWLRNVVIWVREAREVVVLKLENHVSSLFLGVRDFLRERGEDPRNLLESVHESVGARRHLFFADRENPRLPAPLGFSGGWDVRKFGWPSPEQLVEAEYYLVLYGGNEHNERTTTTTTYNESAGANHPGWYGGTQAASGYRERVGSIRDFSKDFLDMAHAFVPYLAFDFNFTNNYGGRFPFPGSLCLRWTGDGVSREGVRSVWRRLPNFLIVDFFEFPTTDTKGPFEFAEDRNAEWQRMPGITTTVEARALEGGGIVDLSDWHTGGVRVLVSGADDRSERARRLIWQRWREGDSNVTRGAADTDGGAGSYDVEEEGTTWLSVAAIVDSEVDDVTELLDGRNVNDEPRFGYPHRRANRSDQRIIRVRIDRTRPVFHSGVTSVTVNEHLQVAATITDSMSGVDLDVGLVSVRDPGGRLVVSTPAQMVPRVENMVLPGGVIIPRLVADLRASVPLERLNPSGAAGEHEYRITVRAADNAGNELWSEPVSVFVTNPASGGAQRPGDCNQDGRLDISDGVCVLGHLFQGSPQSLPCGDGSVLDSGNVSLVDSNGDGGVDLSDSIHVITFLFLGGPPPVLGTDCVAITGCPANCGG